MEMLLPYLMGGLACCVVAGLIGLSGLGVAEPSAIMLYLVPVILCATRWGTGPALFAVAASYVLQDYLYDPPLRAFGISRREDLIALAIFLLTALTTSHLSVSARRAFERAREAEVLRRSDELKSILLSSVSHDLRTPLASIKAAADNLLAEDIQLTPEERRELLAGIEEETSRLTRLVSNLLDLSRIESGHLTPLCEPNAIGEVAASVVDRLAPTLIDHPIEVDVPDELPLARFDYVHVQQILSNLIENAGRHTPPGTRIQIRARQRDGMLQVSVADDGPGIPSSERERIFEKFYRPARSPQRGSGLGLAIARGLAEAQGGSLQLNPAAKQGACFILSLPLGENHDHAS